MREILFRGKRTDNGEWVEGFLVKHPSAVRIGDYSPWYISVPPEDPEANGGLYNIFPETVGQYTGLTDKNGKRIFEGDIIILRGQDLPHWYEDGQRVVVEYDDSGFLPLCEYDSDCGDYVFAEECEVIGNIHDNPELLEGSAEDGN